MVKLQLSEVRLQDGVREEGASGRVPLTTASKDFSSSPKGEANPGRQCQMRLSGQIFGLQTDPLVIPSLAIYQLGELACFFNISDPWLLHL